jgi:hypothetical protein
LKADAGFFAFKLPVYLSQLQLASFDLGLAAELGLFSLNRSNTVCEFLTPVANLATINRTSAAFHFRPPFAFSFPIVESIFLS